MNATVEVLTPSRRYLRLAAAVFTVAAALVVIVAYSLCAWALVKYPWDWSPQA